MSATDEVAAPRSRARNALGSLVTCPLRVPGDLFVQLLKPGDELLDPRVVGEKLRCAREIATEQPLQHGVEEQHRVRAERPVRPARLEEVDRGPGQPAQLDLPGHLLDELLALLLRGLVGQRHAIPSRSPAVGLVVSARAASNAWYGAAPRIAKITCWMAGDPGSSSRMAATMTRAASSSGKPPTPVPSAGKAMLAASISRARAIALRTAESIVTALVRRSRSRDTAWITAFAASRPAGVTIAPPSETGAWRTAANSISSPPARLIAPPTPVDIQSERFAAFTIASTSRSQMSPFQSSIRATDPPAH